MTKPRRACVLAFSADHVVCGITALILNYTIAAPCIAGTYHNETCTARACWSCTAPFFYCTGTGLNPSFSCTDEYCVRYPGRCTYDPDYYSVCTEDDIPTIRKTPTSCATFLNSPSQFDTDFWTAYGSCMGSDWLIDHLKPWNYLPGPWDDIVDLLEDLLDNQACLCQAFESACGGCILAGSPQYYSDQYGCSENCTL